MENPKRRQPRNQTPNQAKAVSLLDYLLEQPRDVVIIPRRRERRDRLLCSLQRAPQFLESNDVSVSIERKTFAARIDDETFVGFEISAGKVK